MIDCETTLLEAVRNRLQGQLTLSDQQCNVESDDIVPAIAGDVHFVVVPAGIARGPRHEKSGGTIDLLLSVRVVVFQKMGDVPKDRRRNIFLERTKGINKRLSDVMDAIDFQYAVCDLANTSLGSSIGSGEGFHHPLIYQSTDPKPQSVSSEPYTAASNPRAGADPTLAIKRGINFTGARFLKRR